LYRRVGRLLHDIPEFATAAEAGRLGVDQLEVLARARANPRCGDRLGEFAAVMIESATTLCFDDFKQVVDRWEALADLDGAHRDHERTHARRTASMHQLGGSVSLHAHGGSAQGAEMKAIFDRYCQAEWHTDWAATKQRYGNDATPALMPRTDAQRRFDALHRMFLDAVSTPADAQAPEPVVSIVVDIETFEETITRMFGADFATDLLHRPPRAERRRCRDPRRRRCETIDGTPLDPYHVVAAALVGQVHRAVFDSASVVIDQGRKQRLFTGAARDAIRLSTNRCLWPGCTLPSGRCHTDHNHEWADGGTTDQANGGPLCHRHNQWKNLGYTVWRDPNGIWHTHRPDGIEIT